MTKSPRKTVLPDVRIEPATVPCQADAHLIELPHPAKYICAKTKVSKRTFCRSSMYFNADNYHKALNWPWLVILLLHTLLIITCLIVEFNNITIWMIIAWKWQNTYFNVVLQKKYSVCPPQMYVLPRCLFNADNCHKALNWPWLVILLLHTLLIIICLIVELNNITVWIIIAWKWQNIYFNVVLQKKYRVCPPMMYVLPRCLFNADNYHKALNWP